MTRKILKKRIAFSLVEVLIVITVLGIMAAYITMNAESTKQTAKSEAEKVAALLKRYITKADKIHGGFYFLIDSDKITVKNNKGEATLVNKETEKEEPATIGCTYTPWLDDKPVSKDIAYILAEISWRTGRTPQCIETRNLEILITNDEDNYPYSIKVTGKGDPYWVVLSYDNTI